MAVEEKEESQEILSISTKLIHGDKMFDGALSPMISTATTFDMNERGNNYTYIRHNQPTRDRLEKLFTKIENGTSSIIYPLQE